LELLHNSRHSHAAAGIALILDLIERYARTYSTVKLVLPTTMFKNGNGQRAWDEDCSNVSFLAVCSQRFGSGGDMLRKDLP
jgi:hypothetical protein